MGDKPIKPMSDRGVRRQADRETELAVLTPPVGVSVTQATANGREDVRATPASGRCLCGHGRPAHRHYRRGSDCGICGAAECAAYRQPGGILRRLLGRGLV